jgi:hypothetical protein
MESSTEKELDHTYQLKIIKVQNSQFKFQMEINILKRYKKFYDKLLLL